MTNDRIAAATVQLPKRGGQGVLIRGGLVMTAAHCIEWNAEGGMAMGDWQVETVKTACGKSFRMHPVFVEPLSDIALLGAPDGGEPELASDWELFDSFCSMTLPVQLSGNRAEVLCEFEAKIRSHKQTWITATGQFCNANRCNVWIKAMSQIEGGASGGPVVDSNGDLLGVVSFTSEGTDASGLCEGFIGFAPRCVPPWLLEVIDADDWPTEGESSETFNSSQNSLSDLPLTP